MKKLLKEILNELKEINKKLPAIESSKEHEKMFLYGTSDFTDEPPVGTECTPD